MNRHPLLRAYLAGIAVPTVVLLKVMAAYTIIRYVYDVPLPESHWGADKLKGRGFCVARRRGGRGRRIGRP